MSTDLILFYSKQPPPGIFCALPPIVPMVRHGSSKPWEMLIFGLCFFNAGSLAISEWTSQTGCHNKSTDFILFYSKQPPPRIFCALPPIVPTWCVKTIRHVDLWSLLFQCRVSCHQWLIDQNIHKHWELYVITSQLISFSTGSNLLLVSSALLLQSCLHGASKPWEMLIFGLYFVNAGSLAISEWTSQTGCHNKSTDFILFYSKQPPPRIFCALPPIVPTWCVKTIRHVDLWSLLFQCRVSCHQWLIDQNIHKHWELYVITSQLISFSTRSNLLLVSSALLLQSCLHGASKPWEMLIFGLYFVNAGSLASSDWKTKKPIKLVVITRYNKSTEFLSTGISLLLASSAFFLQSCLHCASKPREMWIFGLYCFNAESLAITDW